MKSNNKTKQLLKPVKQEPFTKVKINNPWTQQPVKITTSFGLLNSIVDKYYGQQPKLQSKLYKDRKQILKASQQIIQQIKTANEIKSAQNKELLYDKYRNQFDLIGKLVIMNNIIAFINSVKDINSIKQGQQFSTSYVKIPCQSQSTFLKLFYRITKQENIQFTNTLSDNPKKDLESLKARIVSKMYI